MNTFSSSRRGFIRQVAAGAAAGALMPVFGQSAGERPARADGVQVLNPRGRVPLSFIIDDSTCLVNLNHFSVPQFHTAWGSGTAYKQAWRDWPVEIPDAFVRKFGEWCATQGVRGKYSIVPYPACVGRLDRGLPGWPQADLEASLELVRSLMLPNWDIHPEMVTHTRVIDLKTGHPYPEFSLKFMENWEWTTGRSADEIGAYMAYALNILKNVGLPCEGVTTPGGFGNRALPQLSLGSFQAVREVFGAEIPHYFRHLYDKGEESVAPRVENAGGLDGPDPRCVVSIVACTGDWTGGWDNSEPDGVDRYITEDLATGRLVDVIGRGEPACLLSHWTGIWWNGQEKGFNIFKEVVRRVVAKYGPQVVWMKLSEIARYWAAKELTRIERAGATVQFHAPFACPDFTLRLPSAAKQPPRFGLQPLVETTDPWQLEPGTWRRDGAATIVCVALPKGASELTLA